jgi:hypothetical protein
MSRSGSALRKIDAPIRSGQLLEDNGPTPTLLRQDTSEKGPRRKSGQTPVQSSTLTPAVAGAGNRNLNTGTQTKTAGLACVRWWIRG